MMMIKIFLLRGHAVRNLLREENPVCNGYRKDFFFIERKSTVTKGMNESEVYFMNDMNICFI